MPQGDFGHLDLSRIAQDLQIRKVQVEAVVQLLDEGNTIPFITRYRKERTGGLDEEVLRIIQDRIGQLRQLAERKQTILKTIESQGKLTDELRSAILASDNPKRLEDLYLPYKPKKRTLSTAARDKGLEPFALAIWNSDPVALNLAEVLPTMLNPEKGLNTPEDVLLGAQHILAEMIAESADVRAVVRMILWESGRLCTTKSEKLAEGQGLDYKDYFQFTEPVRHIPPHRILAINRGEKENALTVKLEWDAPAGFQYSLDNLPLPLPPAPEPAPEAAAPPPPPPEGEPPAEGAEPRHEPEHHAREQGHDHGRGYGHGHHSRLAAARELAARRAAALQVHPHAEYIKGVTEDALARLLVPSLEREIRRELTHRAEEHAVDVFARNLRSKLLAPPLRGKRVLALDPAFRTGCKVAALDETGNLLEDAVVYPHPPQNKRDEAKAHLEMLVRKHQLSVIAIGNGTACRETEEMVSEVIAALEQARSGERAVRIAEPALAATSEGGAPSTTEAPVPAQPSVALDSTSPEAIAPAEPAAAPSETAPSSPPPAEAASAPPPPPPMPPLPDAPADLAYVIVNEAGASVYSASPVGREEFPNFDATLRGTISIGRRLQDPLAELVKIDPQHVGVGLYQHDVNPKQLRESLDGVIESCVNTVGVDLNTASVPLLRHVSGLNQLVAHDLIEYRKANGNFRSRDQLMQVPGIGDARYTQAAGFLKINDGANPLDRTWIHPESYGLATRVLEDLGFSPEALLDRPKHDEMRAKFNSINPEELAARLQTGIPTVLDILEALARPGRDPREDLPPPVFKKGILKLEDLEAGMELKGTVLNVVDFGAFIDVGLKDSGLVHISQMANRYVKSPYEVAAVGDVVQVWVLAVDKERHRVSLTMIKPGTERKPQERRPPQQRGGERGEREQGPPRREQVARPPRQGQQGQGQGGPPREGGQQGGGERPRGAPPPRQGGGGPQRGGPPPQQGRALPPRGRTRIGGQIRPGQGQGQGRGPGSQQGGAEAAPPASEAAAEQPRKSKKAPPKPNLSQSALAGASPLGTFAELAAFWEAKAKEPTEPNAAEPTAEQSPQETPPAPAEQPPPG